MPVGSDFPRALREMLESYAISNVYPGLTWCTDAMSGMLKVSIPVTPQHSRTHVIGAPDELVHLPVTQLRDLIGFYFPEPSDPHSLLAIIADRASRLQRFAITTPARDAVDQLARERQNQDWQDLHQAINTLQRLLTDILPPEEPTS